MGEWLIVSRHFLLALENAEGAPGSFFEPGLALAFADLISPKLANSRQLVITLRMIGDCLPIAHLLVLTPDRQR
jgi:hypothetical protein